MASKNTRSKKCIFIPRGEQPTRLYVDGAYVRELSDAIFSYNLPLEWGKPSSTDYLEAMFDLVEKAFNSEDFSKTHAVRYWEAAQAQQEVIETIRPINITNEATRTHLFNGFHKAFGKQSCVYTDFQFASHAEGMGWEIVSLRDGPARTAMHAGVKSDLVMTKTLDDLEYVKHDEMTFLEKDRWFYTELILRKLGFNMDVDIVREFATDGFKRKGNHGVYKKDSEEILIAYEVLKGLHDHPGQSSLEFLAIALHELGHHETQASDGSSDFVGFFIGEWLKALANSADGELAGYIYTLVNGIR